MDAAEERRWQVSDCILAIDPGAGGGLAWRTETGGVVAVKMPDGVTEQCTAIRELHPTQVVVERVGTYMPGNSGPAAVAFARHCGNLEGIIVALGLPMIPPKGVTPQTWQNVMGLTKLEPIDKAVDPATRKRILAERKAQRKNEIKELMQRRYPHLKVTLATADALGILTWAIGSDTNNKETR